MSAGGASGAGGGAPGAGTPSSRIWQQCLEQECRQQNLGEPTYTTSSDRRGGRTAWSVSVTVAGQRIPARNWYDGNFLNNAKEDAAQLMLQHLRAVRAAANARR